MIISDSTVEEPQLLDSRQFASTILAHLCGKSPDGSLEKVDHQSLDELYTRFRDNGLDFQEFNKVLALLGEAGIAQKSFERVFGSNRISLPSFREGVKKFKAQAMLDYGNFRFGFENLLVRDKWDISATLSPFGKTPDENKEVYIQRLPPLSNIELINKEDTWLTGYVSAKRLEKQKAFIEDKRNQGEYVNKGLAGILQFFVSAQSRREEANNKAAHNTRVYLESDYMDVYVATSMRERWEFEDAFEFIQSVFSNPLIEPLRLRYFDPTQCKSQNRIDKGLIEALMLKRAKCTIYMAQETDTLGKDSELASTLAQGKPVIAYVPALKKEEYAATIREYPLDYFIHRLLLLRVEGMLEDLIEEDESIVNFLRDFETSYQKFQDDTPLTLYPEFEQEWKRENDSIFLRLCDIVARAEALNYDRRAQLIKEKHPLGIQVNLNTGVANGALVVRSPEDCATLLHGLLTNDLEFEIERQVLGDAGVASSGVILLKEMKTGSYFRVVTEDQLITAAFWKHYLRHTEVEQK